MYLTAMLVRNSARNWEGVNVLLYQEPDRFDPLPQASPARAVIRAIEACIRNASALLGSAVIVPRGGNAVDAYIDVVIAGALQVAALDLIQQRTRQELERPDAAETVAWAEQGMLVRAYVRPDKDPADTLQRLVQASRELVTHPRREQPPIRIVEIRRQDGFEFALDALSTQRLRALHGAKWTSPRIHISDDVRTAFQALHGDIHDHLVAVMTGGIDSPYLTRLGGVEIVDEHGALIWPRP